MKDDWRYVPYISPMIDKLADNVDAEETIISILDGQPGQKVDWDSHVLIDSVLREREADIVKSRIFLKKTFQEIGDEYKISRQRAHQLYNDSIDKMKEYFLSRPKENPYLHRIQMNIFLRD